MPHEHRTNNESSGTIEKGTILLRNKKSNEVYSTVNGSDFTNLTTGTKGNATPEQVAATFVIPVLLNQFAEQKPMIIELIETIGLAIETN